MSVLVGKGNAMFAAPLTLRTGSFPTHIVAADIDGNGKLDLVVCNNNDDNVTVFLNTSK